MKIIKKMDIVIIVFLIVLSFVPNIIFAKSFIFANYDSTYVSITLDGKNYDNIPLSSFKGEKVIEIEDKEHKGYKNKILIKDNTVKMIEANCSDKVCIRQGSISKVGQNIACLPHKLIIEIKGEEKDSSGDLILSH
ncbi:NusG domain II-containing protein [Metaclostridioides mangenotii]|uniref:NusG domain II-containing protein n=1 Tax=Metaclostridioides mangenotii TaxID=1540 RepID=UPI0026F0DDDB|nr:NusG domain II-containing protein [Clostridioides mangenotii]